MEKDVTRQICLIELDKWQNVTSYMKTKHMGVTTSNSVNKGKDMFTSPGFRRENFPKNKLICNNFNKGSCSHSKCRFADNCSRFRGIQQCPHFIIYICKPCSHIFPSAGCLSVIYNDLGIIN